MAIRHTAKQIEIRKAQVFEVQPRISLQVEKEGLIWRLSNMYGHYEGRDILPSTSWGAGNSEDIAHQRPIPLATFESGCCILGRRGNPILLSVTANADNGGIHRLAWWEYLSRPMWGIKDTPPIRFRFSHKSRGSKTGGHAPPQAGLAHEVGSHASNQRGCQLLWRMTNLIRLDAGHPTKFARH